MQYNFKKTVLAASVTLACVISPSAFATNGYASHGFGTIQKAMGGTAVAGSDNAMNMATNPAAMSFGKNNWTAGLDIFVPDRGASHDGPSQAGVGESFDGNGDSNFPIPEIAYQRHVNDKFAVGVAVYGNGGMNATYEGERPIFSPTNEASIDFAQLFVAPSVSMKLNENHSIGASLNLVYQRIKVNGVDGFGLQGLSSDPGSLSNNGYDSSTGAGVSLGWQGKMSDKLTLGLAYRSKTKMSEFDKYSGLLAEQGDFDIPSMITAGLSFKATPKTTIALDFARINYTDVAAISNPNNAGTGPLLGDDDGAGFGWKDQNVVKIGVKHQLNNKLALLAGYNHGKAPIPSSETAFNVLAPATVEDHLTLGMEYNLSKNSNIAFQYMHAFENEIKGDGAPGSFIQTNTGAFTPANINMSQNSFGIAYSKNF